MNLAALNRAGLTLRLLPPRGDDSLFACPDDYHATLAAVQKLRGAVYLADRAVPAEALDSEGRHRSEDDERSYHLTVSNGTIQGCLRAQLYSPNLSAEHYRVSELIRRMSPWSAADYRSGLREFVENWTGKGYRPGETGGWAVSDHYRFNPAALCLPLAGWSFARICTKQVFVAAATQKNGSANMLRRIGGWGLTLANKELPPFFDPYYKCQMELLCFCSETLNPKFEQAVGDFQSLLQGQRPASFNCLTQTDK